LKTSVGLKGTTKNKAGLLELLENCLQ